MIRISKIDGMTIIQPTLNEHEQEDREMKERMAWGRKNPHLSGRVAMLTPYVRELCKRLSHSDPVIVQVEPYEGARPQRCYINVATYCQVKGGQMVTGWKIWDSMDYYNFEHHAVWVDAEGNLTCLTQQLLNEKSVLFLPELVMTADEAEEKLAGIRSEHFFPKDRDDQLACELCDALTLGSEAAFANQAEGELYWRRKAFEV